MHDISYLVNQPNYVLLEPLKEPEELQIEHDKQNYWNISFYFAISKIITKSSTDRALMALYKERMTSIINTYSLEKEEDKDRAIIEANQQFLKALNLTPIYEALSISSKNRLKRDGNICLSKPLLRHFCDTIIKQYGPDEQKTISSLDQAVDLNAAKRFRLKKLQGRTLNTIEKVIQMISTKGPLIVQGMFLHSNHKKIQELGEYQIYKEKGKTEFAQIHTIVLIGASNKNYEELIYYTDPQANGCEKIHTLAFHHFWERLYDLDGMPVHDPIRYEKISAAGVMPFHLQENLSFAFYNPSYSAPCVRIDTPYLLMDTGSALFYAMPLGKIDKSLQIACQQGHKGFGTSFYYAIKRILKDDQIRSEHGSNCSIRRKRITFVEQANSSVDKICIKIEAVNREFLEKYKLTANFLQTLGSFEELTSQLGDICDTLDANYLYKWISRTKPHALSDALDSYTQHTAIWFIELANTMISLGFNLQQIRFNEMQSFESLMHLLRSKGPIVFRGNYGEVRYGKVASSPITKLQVSVNASIDLYGWRKNDKELDHKKTPANQAIVVIGLGVDKGKKYVYWIDPKDPSDPNDSSAQKTYISTYESFMSNLFIPSQIFDSLDEDTNVVGYAKSFQP